MLHRREMKPFLREETVIFNIVFFLKNHKARAILTGASLLINWIITIAIAWWLGSLFFVVSLVSIWWFVGQHAVRKQQQRSFPGNDQSEFNNLAMQKTVPLTLATFYPQTDILPSQPWGCGEETLLMTFPPEIQSSLHLDINSASDRGIKRRQKPNEDSTKVAKGVRFLHIGQQQQWSLLLVADGMGGHANGQEASAITVHHIANYIVPRLSQLTYRTADDLAALLREGIESSNAALWQWNQENKWDSGSTITAALVVGSIALIANVGDSRTYLFRPSEGGLRRISTDHSIVQRLVEQHLISPEDVYTHPDRNKIYRCVGEKESIEVDLFREELQVGDRLLLCSDGLWEMVRDPQIAQILASDLQPGSTACDELIQAALAAGGLDNVSAVVALACDGLQASRAIHPQTDPTQPWHAPQYSEKG